jgi:hypothetical protein
LSIHPEQIEASTSRKTPIFLGKDSGRLGI